MSANERPRLRLHATHVLVGHGAHIGRERIQHTRCRPHMPLLLALRRLDDLRAAPEHRVRNALVYLVIPDLPAAADDAANGIVEPGASASYLDLLARRKPEARSHESVLEHDRDVLELCVEQRGTREAERHAHNLTLIPIDVDGTDHAWLAVVLRPHAHLVDVHSPPRQLDAK